MGLAGPMKTAEVIGPRVEEVVAGFNMAFNIDDGYRTACMGESLFHIRGWWCGYTICTGAEDDAHCSARFKMA